MVIELHRNLFPRYALTSHLMMRDRIEFIFERIRAVVKREPLMVFEQGVGTPQIVDRKFNQTIDLFAVPLCMMD